jgi:integrase
LKKPLTSISLGAMKPQARAYYVGDTKADGLRVRISPSGIMTWNITCRIRGGGLKSISLGKCDPSGRSGLDLASARERAFEIIKAARSGRDIVEEQAQQKEAQAEALTVEDLVDLYSKHISSPHRKDGALRSAPEITRRLKRAMQGKLTRLADSLTKAEISRALDSIADRYPREAEKRRQGLHAMYGWATSKGYCDVNPLFGTPSYGSGTPRERTLTQSEVKTLWGWLAEGADLMPADVIATLKTQLCIGARAGEIAGMTADELTVDGDQMTWLLPAARSKNKRERLTPVVGIAKDIITRALRSRASGPLFRTLDGSRALRSDDIGLALNNRDRPIAHFTTHDLRRTVVSHMDELGIALDTIAAVIGHQRGTRATQTLVRHYSRPKLDSRIEAALGAWDAQLSKIINGLVR